MNFYTSSTFRECLQDLLKRRKDGYLSAPADICKALLDMPDNILRDTNERIIQAPNFRIVKLRVPNSGLRLSKADGFRLIYIVSMVSDDLALLRVFPKRGAKGIVNISDAEYMRLIKEVMDESNGCKLHQVDISDMMSEVSTDGSLTNVR